MVTVVVVMWMLRSILDENSCVRWSCIVVAGKPFVGGARVYAYYLGRHDNIIIYIGIGYSVSRAIFHVGWQLSTG